DGGISEDQTLIILYRAEVVAHCDFLSFRLEYQIKNAADRHYYLLIKAALALLFCLYIRALSLNLQIPPLKRVKVVPQKGQL
ncbi:MAG: hypothetical protein U1D97_15170, partial [Desulfuromonadales bacterium]|nr:hypothetical protein [Desulfuromonadales bacterium]